MSGMWLSSLGRRLLDVVLPVDCVVCNTPGFVLCPRCEERLGSTGYVDSWPTQVANIPLLVVTANHSEALMVLARFKDAGAMELARPLGRLLSRTLGEAHRRGTRWPLVVCAPPASHSWRRRGFVPVVRMLRAASIPVDSTLMNVRKRDDQRGLTVSQRGSNLAGSIAADPALAGCSVILVDDVVTTGATLTECIRALNQVGARVAGIACLTRVPRKFTDSPQMSDKPNSRA